MPRPVRGAVSNAGFGRPHDGRVEAVICHEGVAVERLHNERVTDELISVQHLVGRQLNVVYTCELFPRPVLRGIEKYVPEFGVTVHSRPWFVFAAR
jgi:hypothetical protein